MARLPKDTGSSAPTDPERLNELRITVDERELGFQTDQLVETTYCQALEKLTDSAFGWRTMTQIYERELQRAYRQS